MTSDRRSASPSPTPEALPGGQALSELVRDRATPLLEALETHLPGSQDHAEAAGAYAFAAAAGIGLGHAPAELCRETARLHDVGMVYVPAAILETPYESWDTEQRRVFDAHYEAGAKLALGAGIPDDVCGWLLQIRERFDGGGPEGLAGDSIPVASRVTRAACACDTLLASPASGMTLDDRKAEATTRLRAAAGAELDPWVVEALIASL